MSNGGGMGNVRGKGLAWAVGAWWAGVAAGLFAHGRGWGFRWEAVVDALLPAVLLAYLVPLALGVLVLLGRMLVGWVRQLRRREWGRALMTWACLCGLLAAGTVLMKVQVREPVLILVAILAAGMVCAFAAVACTVGYAVKGIRSAVRRGRGATG